MDAVSRTTVPKEPSAAGATGSAKALVKGLALVEAVSAAPGPVRLGELVDASGLPRPTALRLLDALCDGRVLSLDPSGGYVLGPQLAVWGEQYLERLDVRRHAQDLMRALADETRETCFLGVREHRHVLYVAAADSPQPVRPAARVGGRNPLHSTGIGKALLAFGDPADLRAYLDGGPLEARTPSTFTTAAGLAGELERTRARGYAIDDVENEDGVRCVAVPVRGHTGRVVAALSVAAPAYRFSRDDLPAIAERALATAAELSARLGHRAATTTNGEVRA